jgi:autotransporter-associated beta strand protein
MKRSKRISLAIAAAMSTGALGSALHAATTAYFDDFNAAVTGNGTSGFPGTTGSTITSNGYTYTTTATAGDGGAGVGTTFNGVPATPGQLTLTNDATSTTNLGGLVYTTTPLSGYAGGFNPTLNLNGPNALTWSLNMQQARSNPAPPLSGQYGAAYILGATTNVFVAGAGAASGYAVVFGSTGTPDPVRLVRFTNGLNGTLTPIATTGGNVGTDFWSVKVVYNPTGDVWSLAARDDVSAFADPESNATPYGPAQTAVDTTYTGQALTSSGALWSYSTTTNTVAHFDNLKLSLDVPVVGGTPRDLTWDGDSTAGANPSDVSGTWDGPANWYTGTSHVVWSSSNPDNATFGANTGNTGTTTVTVAAAQNAGKLIFRSNSNNYVIQGAAIQLIGNAGVGIDAQQSAQINASLSVTGPQSWTVASGATLTIGDGTNGALTGGATITKAGTGLLLMNTASPTFSGGLVINGGTVQLKAVDGNGRGPTGAAAITVNNDSVLHIDNINLGQNTPIDTTVSVTLNNTATLLGTGLDTIWRGNSAPRVGNAATNTVNFKTANASDKFTINSSIRNVSTGTAASKITVSGPGRIVLASGATSTAPGGDQFGGSWELQSGILQLGPVVSGGQGEPLNALGYAPYDAVNIVGDGPNGPGRPILITGGTLAGAVNAPNQPTVTATTFRSPITLAGGGIASTNGVDATFAGDITTTASSFVRTDDPVLGGPRSVVLGTQAQGINSNVVPGNMNWGNATLSVTGSGSLALARTQGTVSVTPGAILHIGDSSQVLFGGSQDALSDGIDRVNVVNVSTAGNGLVVQGVGGDKNVGGITGTGNTQVDFGGSLIATSVRQGTLTVNGAAKARQAADLVTSGAISPSVSVVNSLVIGGNGVLNLTNTRLITNDAQGTESGGTYSGVLGQVQSGRNAGPGIITDEPLFAANQTAVGVATAAESKSLLVGQTTMWSGQTVDSNDTLVMYTWAGDANLDGKVNADDYASIDLYSTIPGEDTWNHGDFNFNGVINADDYALIDNNVQNPNYVPYWTTDALRSLDGGSATAGLTAVPEPTSIGLLMVSAAGLMGRRRRTK